MKTNFSRVIIFLVLLCAGVIHAAPFGTAFTYQGRLNNSGIVASGLFDIIFTLHDHPTNPAALGTYVLLTAVPVTDGLFTVTVNTNNEFGNTAFNGAPRWLEIGVRSNGVLDNFQRLSPRQSLDVTPYATFALNAGSANTVPDGAITTSKLAPNSVTASQLAPGAAAANLGPAGGGMPSSGIVLSDREVNGSLTNAGFLSLATPINVTGESWTTLPSGPPATGSLVPARAGHKAVWSGAEMFLIGGSPDSAGLRYNPTANTWSAMNPSNAPAIGSDVHAFWTGTQLIVWDGYHRVGGRYTPGTDTWTAMNDAGAPVARAESSAAFANGYLVVWGGSDPEDELNFFNTGGRYNPTNNTWTATSLANVPLRRAGATAATIGTDIIFFGGKTTNLYTGTSILTGPYSVFGKGELDSGGRYNPAANTWTTIADAPSGRYRHTANWSGTYMLIWGGINLGYSAPEGFTSGGFYESPTASGVRYNPTTDSWTPISTNGRPTVATGHSAAWSATGSLMIWGGENWDNSCDLFGNCFNYQIRTNGGARYLPASDSWLPLAATVATARAHHSAIWTGSQMIIWGGEDDLSDALGDGMRYNLAANTWSTMSPPPASGEPSERESPTAVWTGDALIIWGGLNGSVPLRTGGIYKPGIGWTNTSLAGAPSARFLHSAVWTGTEMLIWGGLGGFSSVPVGTGARFNVSSNRWFPISSVGAPRARASHAAVWTGTEMIVYGGYDFTNIFFPRFLSTIGRYNPATDTWNTNTPSFGTGRAAPTAIWTGTEMITWGGYSHNGGLFATLTYYNSGARYNPAANSWTALPVPAISGRRSHTAVWSGEAMLVWGGLGATGTTNTGASYSPSANSWSIINPSNAPTIRQGHTAVWADPPGQMIVWGGDNNTVTLSTGALYDPLTSRWNTMTNAVQPTDRYHHVAAWTGTEMLMFDGATHAGTEVNTGSAFRPRKIYWLYQKP